MRGALRDAFLSAVVALGLFAPMVGLVTETSDRGLTLRARPIAVAVVVALVFFGRLALLRWRGRGRTDAVAANRAFAERIARAGKYVAPLLLALAVALPLSGSRYYVDLGTLVLTYVMLGWGLNVVVGLAGLLDLGYVAFYAVGAYSYALLAQTFDLGFWTCLPLAGLFAALWGVMLGFPVLRLRGRLLRHRAGDHPAGHLPVLRDPWPRFADQLGDLAPAPDAPRPRLGSAA
jgi:branched-chain amino acid transport system permease protein